MTSIKWAGIGFFGILLGCSLFKKKDIIPPIVEITSPKDSIWFSGELKITVAATDSIGVESVLIYVDDFLIGTDTSEPYEFKWHPQENPQFSWHFLYAKAFDKAQNEGISSIIKVLYIGRAVNSIYHGIVTIDANDYWVVKFSGENKDSLYGETVVNNQDSLARFYLLDETNFNRFKEGERFSSIIEFENFREIQVRWEIPKKDDYYLVWQNLSNYPKIAWIRFYRAR